MPHSESLYSSDWLRIAEKDLLRAKKMVSDDDPELAGFCLQQAIEKFLKAFLLAKGWKLRRIHNLDALLDDAVQYDDSLSQYRVLCIRVTSFYFLERYPSFEVTVTKADVQVALNESISLIEKLRN